MENENTDERAEIREDGILARHFTKRVPYKLPLIKTLSMKFHGDRSMEFSVAPPHSYLSLEFQINYTNLPVGGCGS